MSLGIEEDEGKEFSSHLSYAQLWNSQDSAPRLCGEHSGMALWVRDVSEPVCQSDDGFQHLLMK